MTDEVTYTILLLVTIAGLVGYFRFLEISRKSRRETREERVAKTDLASKRDADNAARREVAAPRPNPAPKPADKPAPKQTSSKTGFKPDTPFRREMAMNARAHVRAFHRENRRTLSGPAWVIDGDTIIIQKTKIRLFGIDAPELDQPYGKKSKSAMRRLCRGTIVTAHITGHLSHDRVVAVCDQQGLAKVVF